MIGRIRRGLPGHPGTPVLLFFAVLGTYAARSWYGAAIMLGVFGPFYLHGAYERGKMLERE